MQNPRIFIKAMTIGPRLRYVAEEVFGRRLGLDFVLGDAGSIPPTEDFLISYGMESRGWIVPESGILKTGTLAEMKFNFENMDFKKVADHEDNRFKTDWLGLIFWFLSRQEEYQMKNQQDQHGRFSPTFSPLFKLDKYRYPWVDFWVERLREQLLDAAILTQRLETDTEISFDIDHMLAFREKGAYRNAGGLVRDFFAFRFGKIAKRISVLTGISADPYASIPEIEFQLRPGMNPSFFIWIGDYGPFDKGLSYENPVLRKTVKLLSEKYRIGLHPSYAVFSSPGKLKKEKGRLEQIVEMGIAHNRFHYLRFRLPESYRLLISNGIEHDFSMGFSEIPGYRAGTGWPFYWYDLEREEKTRLLIHPFAIMDSCARYKLNWNAEKFIAVCRSMKSEAAAVSGKFHVVMHNEFCAWKGWENVLGSLE
jgi:hypothetical protein